MKYLFQDYDKYPIKKIAACPGLMDRKQLRAYIQDLELEAKDKLEPRVNQEASVEPEANVKPEQNNNIEASLNLLEVKQIMCFDINAPEESLEKIFQDPQNSNAKTKEDEENEQKDNDLQVQTMDREITEEDKKKLIAAFAFLFRCHLYQKEDTSLKEKLKKALKDKDLHSLKKIYEKKDLEILCGVKEKYIEDLKRHETDEIKNNALEGRAAKEITRNLQKHSYIQKAHTKANKKEGIEAVNYLSKEYYCGSISFFLDPIQQQIMSDQNPRQLIFGFPATGKTILVQLKALQLLEKDPACKVLIILPLKGVVDYYISHFEGSAHNDRLFLVTFRENWKKLIKDHSPHVLIDEFAYIQVRNF